MPHLVLRKALKFGQSKEAMEPIVRSGQTSTDARVLTAVHASSAIIPLLLPAGEASWRQSLTYDVIMPEVGFNSTLTATCGDLTDGDVMYDEACLQSWYAAEPTPARLGQIIGYEIMYFKIRDGWREGSRI